jgi:hypothetical protein
MLVLQVTQGDGNGITAKVSDFGMSELLSSGGPVMGELGGTVTHIAPEIVTQKLVSNVHHTAAVIVPDCHTGRRIPINGCDRYGALNDSLMATDVTDMGH